MSSKSVNEQLILDGHKLSWHTDRVDAWEAGERIAPVSIDMALTRACQATCRGCYATLQESQSRSRLTTDTFFHFLDDCAEMGVRGISLVSDGESTMSKSYEPFIKRASELGIDIGCATNGWLLTPELATQVLPHMRWIRFTMLAGNARSMVSMMNKDPDDLSVFWKATYNISQAVRIKRKLNLDVTLGIQTYITPKDENEIMDFANLAHNLGVDYAVIKHTSDNEEGALGVDYANYDKLEDALRKAEKTSTEQTKIIVKWSKMKDGNKPSYSRAYGMPFLLQLSGSGLVAPSGMFFNSKYSKLHIGNFAEERFIDIWKSNRYWDAMNYLASPNFDAASMMGALPIQHYANVALDNHVKGIKRIEASPFPNPPHVNFV
jgi:MoaA/NifB/PqqE/SkfB family radical SAM enzyme